MPILETVAEDEIEEFTLVDISNDGIIHVVDVVGIVNHMVTAYDFDACLDLSTDGIINVVDIVTCANFIFSDL